MIETAIRRKPCLFALAAGSSDLASHSDKVNALLAALVAETISQLRTARDEFQLQLPALGSLPLISTGAVVEAFGREIDAIDRLLDQAVYSALRGALENSQKLRKVLSAFSRLSAAERRYFLRASNRKVSHQMTPRPPCTPWRNKLMSQTLPAFPLSPFFSDRACVGTETKCAIFWRFLMARLAESKSSYLKYEFGLSSEKPDPLQFRPNQVFMLMRMGTPESTEVYQIVQEVCHSRGLSVKRADENGGSEIILREIIQNLLEAELLIFDLTNERPNVYFELGYAFGVGNRSSNVLLIAKRGTQIHFDIGLLRIHTYDSPDHLREVLSSRLQAMIPVARQKSPDSWLQNWLMAIAGYLKRNGG